MGGSLNAVTPLDPGAAGPWPVVTRLTDLHDTRRARTLPLKLYLPEQRSPRGLILFSHGLGGSREGGSVWLQHWASHGFAALALQHPGSDRSILRKQSPLALRSAFHDAAEAASHHRVVTSLERAPSASSPIEQMRLAFVEFAEPKKAKDPQPLVKDTAPAAATAAASTCSWPASPAWPTPQQASRLPPGGLPAH